MTCRKYIDEELITKLEEFERRIKQTNLFNYIHECELDAVIDAYIAIRCLKEQNEALINGQETLQKND